MRVLALVTDGFGAYGGIARYNQVFLRAFASLDGIEQVVVIPRFGQAPERELPGHLGQLPPSSAKTAYLARVLAAVARPTRFDLLFCGHINMAPLAAAVARLFHCPWWLQIHGVDAWDPPGRLVRAAVARANLVTAVSRYTRQRFLSWAKLAPEKVRILPNVLDPRFTPGAKPVHLLQRYRLEGRRILLTVGRISRHDRAKGHDRVIRALPALRTRFPDLAYAIAGDGDGRARLEALAREHGVADIVHFLGRVPDDELVDHYRMTDVFVMPSTKEGFGIVFLEAMACGIPAIGGDSDGSPDPLSGTKLGRAVPPEKVADAIADVIENLPRDDPSSTRCSLWYRAVCCAACRSDRLLHDRTMSASLGDRARSAVLWNTGFNLFRQGLQFAVMLVLVRLLDPAAYGQLALTTSIIGFVALLSFNNFLAHSLQPRSDAEVDFQLHFTAGFAFQITAFVVGNLVALIVRAVPAYAETAPLISYRVFHLSA